MKWFKFFAGLVLGATLSTGALASDEIPVGVTGVVGLTLEDPKPDGCMTCHKIKQIKGKTVDHRLIQKPDMQAVEAHRDEPEFANIKNIPGDEEEGCNSCHMDFADLMHDKHFNNPTPEKSLYVTKYFAKVGCMGCHAFENDEEFGMSITTKGGAVNWTPEEFKKVLAENQK